MLIALLSLAVGIGVNAAVFSLGGRHLSEPLQNCPSRSKLVEIDSYDRGGALDEDSTSTIWT